eukprot:GHVT01015680.1.p1 GENE.GHVT01015680.1~~GHVT01015680.1.p1  ORF type:complete len:149 (+),score=24.20 GHVT01015680.1:596-1042(+)
MNRCRGHGCVGVFEMVNDTLDPASVLLSQASPFLLLAPCVAFFLLLVVSFAPLFLFALAWFPFSPNPLSLYPHSSALYELPIPHAAWLSSAFAFVPRHQPVTELKASPRLRTRPPLRRRNAPKDRKRNTTICTQSASADFQYSSPSMA